MPKKVISEIQNCEKLAEQVGKLDKGLALAAGYKGIGQVRAANTPALVGRSIKSEKEKDKKIYYCAPKAYHWFLYGVNQVYREEEGSV